jgi:hypothetical protein
VRIYSQWDWDALGYRYFEGQGQADRAGYAQLRGTTPALMPTKSDGGKVGFDISDALRPLPSGVRYIGFGVQARGELVRPVGGQATPAAASARAKSAGLGNADVLLEQVLLNQQKAHPGITFESLDNPPVVISVMSGLVMGFGLGQVFKNNNKVVLWSFGLLLSLTLAGMRREAYLKDLAESKKAKT